MASKSASQGVPAGNPVLRSRSLLHKESDASTKCNSCSTFARSISSRNRARCTLVLPGKSSTTEIPFDKRAQTCGVSAFFNREEHLMNPGMSVISPENKSRNRPAQEEQHFLEGPNFLQEWTCLPPSCRKRTSTSLKCSRSCAPSCHLDKRIAQVWVKSRLVRKPGAP